MNTELTSENIFTYIKISDIFPKYPTTRIRLKKPWSTKPRKSKFLAQDFLTFPKKTTHIKFLILSRKNQPNQNFLYFSESVWKNR